MSNSDPRLWQVYGWARSPFGVDRHFWRMHPNGVRYWSLCGEFTTTPPAYGAYEAWICMDCYAIFQAEIAPTLTPEAQLGGS